MWRNYPWLLALVLAPLLFGCVTAEGQVVVAVLLAISVLLLAGEIGSAPRRHLWLTSAVVLLVLLPVLPLPIWLVDWIAPARGNLARLLPADVTAPPTWLPLALSPTGAVQRLWELALLVTLFALSRHASRSPKFPIHLAGAVALGLALLALADVWYRWDGQRSILGIWTISWGKGAGTFANRNHFADWVFVGGLFVAGAALREWLPLRSTRQSTWRSHRFVALASVVAVTFSFIMAIASGSRGGVIAFAAGLVTWIILLTRHSHRRQRALWIGLVLVGVVLLVALAGETLFRRFGEVNAQWAAQYPKLSIWRDSLFIGRQFPLFGTGWGGFVHVFSLFKTFGGDSSFLHAENDWLQLFVENGVLGSGIFLATLVALLARPVRQTWHGQLGEPELIFGAWAGLVAFAVHAGVEFVFQVPATALLAAALLGVVAGGTGGVEAPAVLPPPPQRRVAFNLAWALALLAAAFVQGAAFWHWRSATQARDDETAIRAGERSLQWWPLVSSRQLALARWQSRQFATAPRKERIELFAKIRRRLTAALALDPANWELRMEHAALASVYAEDRTHIRAEVLAVVRANPRQVQISTQFARYLVARDPDFAHELLRRAVCQTPKDLAYLLEAAWEISSDTGALWQLTPHQTPFLETLVTFALEKNLHGLVAEACARLAGRVDAARLADYLLRARRPEEALKILPARSEMPAIQLLQARAHHARRDYRSAISTAQSIWLSGPAVNSLLTTPATEASPTRLLEEWQAQPGNPLRARRLAEAIFQQPLAQRDLPLLRRLASDFPMQLRHLWLVWQTEMDLALYPEASATALALAEKSARATK